MTGQKDVRIESASSWSGDNGPDPRLVRQGQSPGREIHGLPLVMPGPRSYIGVQH